MLRLYDIPDSTFDSDEDSDEDDDAEGMSEYKFTCVTSTVLISSSDWCPAIASMCQ